MSNWDFIKDIGDMLLSDIEDSKYRLSDVETKTWNLEIYNTLLAMDKYHCFENCKYNCEFSPIFKEDNLFTSKVYNKNYLVSALDEDIFAEYGLNLSHIQLQQLAEHFGLKTYGRKADIIKRISDNVDLKKVEIGYWDVSPKGWKFIEEHDYIRYFNDFLFDFNFADFENYCVNHDGDLNCVLQYLKEHINLASKKGAIIWKSKSLLEYSSICKSEGIDAFEESIEEFCLRPMVDVDKISFASLFYIFESRNFENIYEFSKNHSLDEMDALLDKYYFDDCRITKSDMSDILHKILTCDSFFDFAYGLQKLYGQK